MQFYKMWKVSKQSKYKGLPTYLKNAIWKKKEKNKEVCKKQRKTEEE